MELIVAGEKGKKIINKVGKADREVTSGFVQDRGIDDIQYNAGEYYVYVAIEWKNNDKKRFGFAVYGVGEAKIEEVNGSECENFGKSKSSAGGYGGYLKY